jgi:hypothetical protein
MLQIDRTTARALTESGYMPLSEYIQMFGAEIAAESATERRRVWSRRTRKPTLPRHSEHRPIYNKRRLAS